MRIGKIERKPAGRVEIEKLYMEHRDKLLTFVKITVENENVADDIVQDVFVEALRKYEEFKVHPNQLGWLYLAARYKIMEYSRKLTQAATWEPAEESQEKGDRDGGYLATELNLAIAEVLTPDELLRFRRYFLWGYTVEELAEREGVTINNMRVRITRLREKVMREVEQIRQ